jgi:hypothetical protein
MAFAVTLDFLAPIPVGNRIQIVRWQLWVTPLFGGSPHWDEIDEPIVVDLETGVVYCALHATDGLTTKPLAFAKPDRRFSSVLEGRVASCIVAASAGDTTYLKTLLTIEPTPQGYRG